MSKIKPLDQYTKKQRDLIIMALGREYNLAPEDIDFAQGVPGMEEFSTSKKTAQDLVDQLEKDEHLNDLTDLAFGHICYLHNNGQDFNDYLQEWIENFKTEIDFAELKQKLSDEGIGKDELGHEAAAEVLQQKNIDQALINTLLPSLTYLRQSEIRFAIQKKQGIEDHDQIEQALKDLINNNYDHGLPEHRAVAAQGLRFFYENIKEQLQDVLMEFVVKKFIRDNRINPADEFDPGEENDDNLDEASARARDKGLVDFVEGLGVLKPFETNSEDFDKLIDGKITIKEIIEKIIKHKERFIQELRVQSKRDPKHPLPRPNIEALKVSIEEDDEEDDEVITESLFEPINSLESVMENTEINSQFTQGLKRLIEASFISEGELSRSLSAQIELAEHQRFQIDSQRKPEASRVLPFPREPRR